MDEKEALARRFEADRPRLRSVAYRMLGSLAEADDAVQEAWLRLSRTDADGVDNLSGWLTTVVSRVSLDMLRSRSSRREDPVEEFPPAPSAGTDTDPEHQALLADSMGPALLVILETLGPAERLAFVLHDLFAVPFEEIAPIVGRSPAATRQLASRARRRVQGASVTAEADRAGQTAVVAAFLAAARGGDFQALVELLDPEVVLRADAAAVQAGAEGLVTGFDAVARTFSGRARFAEPALIDGVPGAIWAPGGAPRVVFAFTVIGGVVTGIELLADPETLELIEWERQ